MTRTFFDDLGTPYELIASSERDGVEHVVIRRLPKPVNRWRVEKNGEYFIVGFGLEVTSQQDTRSKEDNDWYEVGNYFATREHAQAAAEWLKHGLHYIHSEDHLSLDTSIERLIEARKIVQGRSQ